VGQQSLADRIAAELGSAHVTSDPVGLVDYADPFPIGADEEFAPALAARPGSVEEVQAVLRIARETRTPVWTVSRGRNNGYGGRSPRVAGSIVLHLERMNRVLDLDLVSGTALIEPGVSFSDLYAALQDAGGAFWPSVPDLSWGSVIGNALDRGMGYTAFGENNAALAGLEVVLADGDVVRTGMGAMPGSKSWQIYRPGFGPSVEGLFSQSNYGIVTKAGVWLMARPERWAAVDIAAFGEGNLAPLMDTLRPFKLDGTIPGTASTADVTGIASFIAPRSHWEAELGFGPGDRLPADFTARLMEQFGLGRWNMQFPLYGSRGVLAARIDAVRAAFEAAVPGARISITEYEGETPASEVAEPHRTRGGIPGMYVERMPYWWGGGGGHIAVTPVSPITGADATRLNEIVRRRFDEADADWFSVFCGLGRHMLNIAQIMYDRDDPAQAARSRQLARVLIRDLAAEGYGEYRTHIALMDDVAASFDWNEHALGRLQTKIKDALDPDGILSPGKSGIWPSGNSA
jgi:4-cresol dehydrogenase (hydroxylating)